MLPPLGRDFLFGSPDIGTGGANKDINSPIITKKAPFNGAC
jgi:hypothetical protein